MPRSLQGDHVAQWLAWVVMPDHLHALVRLDGAILSEAMRRLKGESARRINYLRRSSGRLWQPGYFDRALRNDDDRRAAARCLVANPVQAGIVDRVGDYPHWDSVWL